MKKILAVMALFVLVGCSTVSRIGEIGTHDIYRVATWDMVSPSTTTIFTYNKPDGALTKIEGGAGPSFLGQFLGPAAVTAAGIYIGKGLEKSGDESNITSTSDARAGAMSASAASGIGPAGAGNSWIGIGYP